MILAIAMAAGNAFGGPLSAAAARAPGPSVVFTSPSSSLLVGSALRLSWIESAVWSVPIVSRRVVTYAGVPRDGQCSTAKYSAVSTEAASDPPGRFTVSGLVAGRCYYWTVRVTDVAGASSTARSLTIRVGNTDPTGAFIFPRAGGASDGPPGAFTLSWNERSTAGIVSRELTEEAAPVVAGRSCDGVTWTTTRTFTPAGASLAVGSLGAGSTRMCYRYGLLVRDANGVAAWTQSGPLLVTPEPPWCAYGDLPTTRSDYEEWATTLLDPTYRLSASYVPPDLVPTSGIRGVEAGFRIRSVAYADLAALADAARKAGVPIDLTSGYRSYASQRVTYDLYVKALGRYGGLLRAARPGHSEHQLGTAIDVRAARGPAPDAYPDWTTTKTGAWLRDNAWRYGWLMSYPRDTSPGITCYQYEPWHYRYVGRDMAVAVRASGLTLREYLWRSGSLAPGT
jgi:D-alanyl-D-alanine carboxypeptidase